MKQYSSKIKLINSQRGFTLIEMIIAVSIFVLVLLMATNIYLTINNTQRKVVTMQKIQDDVRYLFEAMAQEVRLGSINYEFYVANNIDLHPLAGSDNTILAIFDQGMESIFFRRSSSAADANDGLGNKVQYCKISEGNNCALDDDSLWQDVTPEGVEVEDLRFIITPSADPFSETAEQSCAADSDCAALDGYLSYRCDTAVDHRCEYYSDGHNFQPKVKIILKTKGTGRNIAEESEMAVQTTVSLRIAPGKVQNNNYD